MDTRGRGILLPPDGFRDELRILRLVWAPEVAMPVPDRVRELLDRWIEAQRQGISLSPAELCEAAPEWRAELERQIEAYRDSSITRPNPSGADLSQETRPERAEHASTRLPGTVVRVEIEEYPSELGGFRLTKVLGQGGMGRVYLADDDRLGRQVAVKVMRPDIARDPRNRERFLREARATAAVNHDHVVTIHQVGEENGIPFLVMPLLRGESLDARSRRGEAIPIKEALRIAREVAEGLAAAHERGLIHRDVKPANIWLEGEKRRVKILDFGLAKIVKHPEGELTERGAVLGTPSFMAPEQARGLPIDARADLFSLGCVLYHMLTGERPFGWGDPIAVLTSLALDAPRPPHEIAPGCPPAASELTLQLLEKRIERRPASAREVAERLAEIEAGFSVPPASTKEILASSLDTERDRPAIFVPEPTSSRSEPPTKFSRSWIWGTALAALILGTGWMVVFPPKRPSESSPSPPIDPPRISEIKTPPLDAPREAKRDVDREAAAFVLSLGGTVRVNQGVTDIRAERDLPREPFRLVYISIDGNKQLTDESMKKLKDCQHVWHLSLRQSSVTDEALSHLAGYRQLRLLDLYLTRVGDAGVAHFRECKELKELHLYNTLVGDAGLAGFKDCKNVVHVGLNSTRVTDAGLATLRAFKSLQRVYLDHAKIGDAGLAHLAESANLEFILLDGTQVTDAGLAHLQNCRQLKDIRLKSTRVTAAGIGKLQGWFPKCKVEWDQGVIEPKK